MVVLVYACQEIMLADCSEKYIATTALTLCYLYLLTVTLSFSCLAVASYSIVLQYRYYYSECVFSLTHSNIIIIQVTMETKL